MLTLCKITKGKRKFFNNLLQLVPIYDSKLPVIVHEKKVELSTAPKITNGVETASYTGGPGYRSQLESDIFHFYKLYCTFMVSV